MKRRTLSDPKGDGRNGAGPAVPGGSVYGQVAIGKQIEAELRQQGGTTGALMDLADAMRQVGQAVEGVAMEIDHERRGARSCLARQCASLEDVTRLVDTTLLHADQQAILLLDAAAALQERLARMPASAREAAEQVLASRRDQAARTGGGS